MVYACGRNVFSRRPKVGKSCQTPARSDGFDECGGRCDEAAGGGVAAAAAAGADVAIGLGQARQRQGQNHQQGRRGSRTIATSGSGAQAGPGAIASGMEEGAGDRRRLLLSVDLVKWHRDLTRTVILIATRTGRICPP